MAEAGKVPVDKSLFDANTILKADADNTPIALPVAASRLLGRAAAGGIAALTAAEALTLLDALARSLFDANTIVKADADNTPIALSVPASRILGRAAAGGIAALTPAQALVVLGALATSLFGNNTILKADVAGTPTALTVAASRIIGRGAAGNIAALTGAQIMAILTGQAGADFSMNTHKITSVVDPAANQDVATKKYVDDLLTAHALLDTGVHGAGGDTLAVLAEVLDRTKVVWKDTHSGVLDIDSNDPAIGWTEIDVTAVTSAKCIAVIMEMRFLVNTTGTAGSSYLALRKKGALSIQYPAQVYAAQPNSTVQRHTVIQGVDSDHIFEYSIAEATAAAGFAIDLTVMGYIEED